MYPPGEANLEYRLDSYFEFFRFIFPDVRKATLHVARNLLYFHCHYQCSYISELKDNRHPKGIVVPNRKFIQPSLPRQIDCLSFQRFDQQSGIQIGAFAKFSLSRRFSRWGQVRMVNCLLTQPCSPHCPPPPARQTPGSQSTRTGAAEGLPPCKEPRCADGVIE